MSSLPSFLTGLSLRASSTEGVAACESSAAANVKREQEAAKIRRRLNTMNHFLSARRQQGRAESPKSTSYSSANPRRAHDPKTRVFRIIANRKACLGRRRALLGRFDSRRSEFKIRGFHS